MENASPNDEQRSASALSDLTSSMTASSGNAIQQELQQLRGDLFDISDADSSVALILTKVQQLTDFENRVVEDQKAEIETLKDELDRLHNQLLVEKETARKESESASSAVDGLESAPSFGSITMASSSSGESSAGFTNESERPSSYSLHANDHLAEKSNLSQCIAMLTASKSQLQQELGMLNASKSELEEDVDAATEELERLENSRGRIPAEIDNLKRQVQMLLRERTKLIQEVEVYNHQSELAHELDVARESNDRLREGAGRAEELIARAVQGRLHAERTLEQLRDRAEQAERSAQQVKEQSVQEWEKAVREKEIAEERLEVEANEVFNLRSVQRERKAVIQRELQRMKEELERECLVRNEMQNEMRILYEEKIACEMELDDLKKAGYEHSGHVLRHQNAFPHEAASSIQRLKSEMQALRGENASLRSTSKRDSEVIAGLNHEIRSLMSTTTTYEATPATPTQPAPSNVSTAMTPVMHNTAPLSAAASRKRALILSQGSVGEDERSRQYKRSIHYEPRVEQPPKQRERFNSTGSGSLEMIDGSSYEPQQRERLGSSGSNSLEQIESGSVSLEQVHSGPGRDRLDTGGSDTVSALHEADNVSLLFGQESISGKSTKSNKSNEDTAKSDHDGIRAHAEKLLYWANKASERSKKSDASVASQQQQQTSQAQQQTIASSSSQRQVSPIPKTIGLPPRSQSRVRKSSMLPPRCPPAPSTVSQETGTITDGSSTILSDKENGGSFFNRDRDQGVPGAFPTLPTRGKKNVSLCENDTIIHNLDYVVEDEDPIICCECSASPFSGNDPQSEFYLPKLGMACTCGGVNNVSNTVEDNASFSRNPTALSSILRSWQCDFLSSLNVHTADELLKVHKADANDMARRMKKWRASQNMAASRSKECYIALKIWSRTCKVVLRSIREQKELAKMEGRGGAIGVEDGLVIEKPHFLDIQFADTHTIASISTLGQLSSVGGGGRLLEMMEI